jgi:threonine dehydrogenase-like Zn-dependent dehydrogenase
VALYEHPGELDANALVHKEVTMRGTAMVTADDFRTSLDLLSSNRATATPLITHRLPLARIADAFETQLDPTTTIKVMIAEER